MTRKMNSLVLFLCLLGWTSAHADVDSIYDLQRRSQNASAVFSEIMQNAEQSIPSSLLQKATCIATFPDVVRGGFIVGVRAGKGLVSCRTPKGQWSEPSFMKVRAISYGAQIGISAIDLILVFTRNNAIDKFSKDNVTIGAGLSAAAGPVGRDRQVGIDYELNSDIYSYSQSRGLFAGVTVEGSVLKIDDEANAVAYSGRYSAKDLLITPSRSSNPGYTYPQTLSKYSLNKKQFRLWN